MVRKNVVKLYKPETPEVFVLTLLYVHLEAIAVTFGPRPLGTSGGRQVCRVAAALVHLMCTRVSTNLTSLHAGVFDRGARGSL